MSLHPVHVLSALTSSTLRIGDTCVLTLAGGLDASDPLRAGRAVEAVLEQVESALSPHPRALVVDLARVEPSRFVVGLLGLVRRRAVRTSVPLVLAALPPGGEELLERAKVAPLYPAFPDIPSALQAVAGWSRPPAATPTRMPAAATAR